MTRSALERTAWSYVRSGLIFWFPIAACCQEPPQTGQDESWLTSIVLFAFLGLAAAATAVAISIVRRWH